MAEPGPGPDAVRNEISGGVFLSGVIQGADVAVHLRPDPTPAMRGLPAPAPTFTGRPRELDYLRQALASRPDESGPSPAELVTTVSGIAGVGKTELVLQAAHRALADGWFPGGAIFADLSGHDPAGRVRADQALEGLLRALGVDSGRIPAGTADRARLYRTVLAAMSGQGRPILVLVDAATRDQAEPLIPGDGQTRVIMTSRGTLRLPGARSLDLGALPGADGVELLRRILAMAQSADTRIADEPEDAVRVADLCGGLPLALRIAGALLAEDPGRPLAAMAADLDDERTRLDELSYPGGALRAAFDVSYQQLDAESGHLFRLLPLIAGPDVTAPAAAALAGISEAAARRVLAGLTQLIEHCAGRDRWRMPDLVRLYADEHGHAHAEADGRAAARLRLLGYFGTVEPGGLRSTSCEFW